MLLGRKVVGSQMRQDGCLVSFKFLLSFWTMLWVLRFDFLPFIFHSSRPGFLASSVASELTQWFTYVGWRSCAALPNDSMPHHVTCPSLQHTTPLL